MDITVKTIEVIRKCFPADKEELLINECGNNLPFEEECDSEELERIHFAAIKASNGDIEQLKSVVNTARLDWRDLLVRAGFATNTEAHTIWANTVL